MIRFLIDFSIASTFFESIQSLKMSSIEHYNYFQLNSWRFFTLNRWGQVAGHDTIDVYHRCSCPPEELF